MVALSPTQRNLVDKALAVRQVRQETAAIKRAIDDAAHAHVEAVKQRSRHVQRIRDGKERDRALIIRHVGESLARVALREQEDNAIGSNHKASKPHGTAGMQSPAQSSNNAKKEDTGDDDYDEERFGPVRRPPRQRPPNVWATIYEHEEAEVKQTRVEEHRQRLAAAAQFREQLAQQEAEKNVKRQNDRHVAASYAEMQARQVAEWRSAEQAKLARKHNAMVEESKRCQLEMQVAHEQHVAQQRKKEQHELRVLERYKKAMEDEKRLKEAKKQAHREQMQLVALDNERQLAFKRAERLKEQEEEKELQKAYERKLELQEQARQAELAAILEKQSQKVKLALLNVKSAEEKAKEDEERAAAIQAQVRQREEQERLRRERRKKEIVAKQVQALAEQRAERREQRALAIKEEDEYARAFKQDYQHWLKQEGDKQMRVKQRSHAYQQLVLQQMDADSERKANADKYGMSATEMDLNAALLHKVGLPTRPSDRQR
ncbi:TPA: hypothetical protein N0F65_002358 [Lagenidium giganteum]|uniref:Trichohyalin-plectin-homology domain-containing protein n=1 Tax=Lagenidium giganteum TaxID=4803 RepID=A0AAV2YN53_9STRA|nr:TPA: hypothetical protein N0F65_002358 [Lagenidium giganteum]